MLMNDHITIPDYSDWTADQITYQIMDQHHEYVRRKVPAINALLNKAIKQIAQPLPALTEIRSKFYTLGEELLEHLDEEENEIFPYILQLTSAQKLNTEIALPHLINASRPIHRMENDHLNVRQQMARIRLLCADFDAPRDAPEAFVRACIMLKEFEADLQLHIYLEDNILFPSICKLETELKK